jgi:hypothetical protein
MPQADPRAIPPTGGSLPLRDHPELPRLSTSYARLLGTYLRITTSSATGAPRYSRRSRIQNSKLKNQSLNSKFKILDFTFAFWILYFALGYDERSEERPFDLHALSTPPAFILS